ncbi:peroxide stress protein YaaA [Vibrio sp.]|nr:peroxide stress protein YaaA [Vibrio sp.]
MLIVVSPAKTLDYESPIQHQDYTLPDLVAHSAELIEQCRHLTPSDIATLMKVSDKIAALNAARFEQWSPEFNFDNAKQAIFAFKGDVYTGLDAETLPEQSLAYTQHHLRMLSGLYGLLRPLDLMQPYRLEMGTKLKNDRGSNLYQFWDNLITTELNKQLTETDSQYLVNLASNEYFKAVKTKKLQADVITPIFKDCKNGQYKVISFYAKKARGMMARYLIDNQINKIEELKKFDVAGYYFCEEESSAKDIVFKREEQIK